MRKGFDRRHVLQGMAAVGGLAVVPKGVARAQGAPIRIGFIGPLSGPAQVYGTNTKLAAEIAFEGINATGGINGRPLQLVAKDDKAAATGGVAALRELVGDGINVIAGPQQTGPLLATVPLLKELNCVIIGMGSGDDRLTHEFFTPNFFQGSPSNFTRIGAFAKLMATKFPNATTWTGIIPNISTGTESWRTFGEGLKREYLSQHQKTVTLEEPTAGKFGGTDFRTNINQLDGSKAQGLWQQMFGADGMTFYQQAIQTNVFKKFEVVADYTYLEFELIQMLKNQMPGNVWNQSFWYPAAAAQNPGSEILYRELTKRAGNLYPISLAASGYTAASAIGAALKSTGGDTNTEKVIAALESVPFETPMGKSTFRKGDHQLMTSTYFFRTMPIAEAPGWKVAESLAMDLGPLNPPATPGVPLRT